MFSDRLEVPTGSRAPRAAAWIGTPLAPAAGPAAQRTGRLLAALTLLFACRVIAQAMQRWQPHSMLPPFAAFQGSSLPYGLLLGIQIALLALMTGVAWRIHADGLGPHKTASARLNVIGIIYFAAMFVRLVIGLSVPAAPAWFSATIPAFFHLVLAGYVLVLAAHLRPARHGICSADSR